MSAVSYRYDEWTDGQLFSFIYRLNHYLSKCFWLVHCLLDTLPPLQYYELLLPQMRQSSKPSNSVWRQYYKEKRLLSEVYSETEICHRMHRLMTSVLQFAIISAFIWVKKLSFISFRQSGKFVMLNQQNALQKQCAILEILLINYTKVWHCRKRWNFGRT